MNPYVEKPVKVMTKDEIIQEQQKSLDIKVQEITKEAFDNLLTKLNCGYKRAEYSTKIGSYYNCWTELVQRLDTEFKKLFPSSDFKVKVQKEDWNLSIYVDLIY